MLFQIQTWLALKTKMSRKEIKPTEEGMEDDNDDDPGVTKLMSDCDDLIKGLESDIRSVNTRKSRKKDKKGSTYNEEIRELIRDCDEVIKSIEADLALARKERKRSKRAKRSKYIKEVRQLIRECDDLINDIESDLSIVRASMRANIGKIKDGKKEFKAECAELIQGIYLDILAIKLKDPFKQKKMLKRCDNLLKELENGL